MQTHAASPPTSSIEYRDGDLFDSGADMLVNPVNCVGVAGAGLAKEFRQRMPWAYHAYRSACQRGAVVPGRTLLTMPGRRDLPVVAHLPTKRHWRDESQLRDVEAGLRDLRSRLMKLPMDSVAVPRLGCGLGGLPWPPDRELIVTILGDLPRTRVLVYGEAPERPGPSWDDLSILP